MARMKEIIFFNDTQAERRADRKMSRQTGDRKISPPFAFLDNRVTYFS